MSDNAAELSLDDRIAAAFGDGVKSGDCRRLDQRASGRTASRRCHRGSIGEALANAAGGSVVRRNSPFLPGNCRTRPSTTPTLRGWWSACFW